MDAETRPEENRPGAFAFVILFVALAVLLLTQIGTETKFSPRGKLFAQPRFWPAVGVAGMVGFGLAWLATHWRGPKSGWLAEMLIWARAFEYLAWFMVYVSAVPVIGYLASTLLFTVLLALRQGYRDRKTLLMAGGLGLCIVLLFKTGLSVKIPGGAVYEYLPSALRNFMIVNF